VLCQAGERQRGIGHLRYLDTLARRLQARAARRDAGKVSRRADACSHLSRKTKGRGRPERRSCDALERELGTVYADGAIATVSSDPVGRRLADANRNGIWTRSYGGLGRTLTELGPGYPSGLPLTSLYL